MTRSAPVVNPAGARSAGPRLPLPTQEELRSWYVSLRARPESEALRREIGVPIVRPIVSKKDSYRATVHGTIDGERPLCGYPVQEFWTEHPKYGTITCQRCNTMIDDEGYDRG